MTNETVIAILSELKKCYLGGIVDALDFAIEAVKAREPRVMTTKSVGAAGHPAPTRKGGRKRRGMHKNELPDASRNKDR